MNHLFYYFWLFYTEPVQFVSEWIANSKNIQNILLPAAIFTIIFGLISQGLYLTYSIKNSMQNSDNKSGDLIKKLLNSLLSLFLTLGYFPIIAVLSGKDILQSLLFGLAISGITIVSLIAFVSLLSLFLSILSLFSEFLTLNFKSVSNAVSSCNPIGLALTFVIIFCVFTIFKNPIIAMSAFLGIPWWVIIIISCFYSLIYFVFNLVFCLFSHSHKAS